MSAACSSSLCLCSAARWHESPAAALGGVLSSAQVISRFLEGERRWLWGSHGWAPLLSHILFAFVVFWCPQSFALRIPPAFILVLGGRVGLIQAVVLWHLNPGLSPASLSYHVSHTQYIPATLHSFFVRLYQAFSHLRDFVLTASPLLPQMCASLVPWCYLISVQLLLPKRFLSLSRVTRHSFIFIIALSELTLFTCFLSVSPLLCKLCSHLVWDKC